MMKISGTNPETGEKVEEQAENIGQEFIDSMSFFEMADEEIKKFIDNLNVSADVKALLHSFSKATLRIGERIVKIGKKIIEFIGKVAKEFPTASFGFIFGAIAGFLISAIPILGLVLGPLVTPILMALGLIAGVVEDIKDKALARKIAEINAKFDNLRPQEAA